MNNFISRDRQNQNKMLVEESREQATRWKNQKEKLRREFPILTDDDSNFHEKQKSEMLVNLAAKLGLSVERIQIIMEHQDKPM